MMPRLLLLLLLLAVVPCSAFLFKCQPIAAARCYLGMFFLDFDVYDFDKYNPYFNDDSIMESASSSSSSEEEFKKVDTSIVSFELTMATGIHNGYRSRVRTGDSSLGGNSL
jgi:hypothetical protein